MKISLCRDPKQWRRLLLKIAASLFALGIAWRLAALCVHRGKEDAQGPGGSRGCKERAQQGRGLHPAPRAAPRWLRLQRQPLTLDTAIGVYRAWGCRELQEWPVEGCSRDFNLPILFKSVSWTGTRRCSGPRNSVTSVLYFSMGRVWKRMSVKRLSRCVVVPLLGCAL